jgi:hypothetical protein
MVVSSTTSEKGSFRTGEPSAFRSLPGHVLNTIVISKEKEEV